MNLSYLFFSLFSSLNNVCDDYIGKIPAKFVQNNPTIKNGEYISRLYFDEDGSFYLQFSCNGRCGPHRRTDPYTGVWKFHKIEGVPEVELHLFNYNDNKKEPIWEYPNFVLEAEFNGNELLIKKGWRDYTTPQIFQKSDNFDSWVGRKGTNCNRQYIDSCDRAHECNNRGQCITKNNVYPSCSKVA